MSKFRFVSNKQGMPLIFLVIITNAVQISKARIIWRPESKDET